MEPLLNQVRGQEPWRIHNVDHRRLLAKTREEGREEGLQEGREEGVEEGIQKGLEAGMKKGRLAGRKEGMIEAAANLIRLGVAPEVISSGTGLSMEEVLKLKEQN